MSRRIRYHDNALADLDNLEKWVEERAGSTRADLSVDAIIDYCDGFVTFPLRGAKRDDLHPGLRMIGFRRRVTIAFTVSDDEVLIWRVLPAGRNIDDFLDDSDPP